MLIIGLIYFIWKEQNNLSILDSETKFLVYGRALNATVKLDPVDVVGKKYKVNNYLDEKHPPRDFYSHIKPEIEDAMTKTFTFDILFHNSEHQATLLRYGVKKSEQVRDLFFINRTMNSYSRSRIILMLRKNYL